MDSLANLIPSTVTIFTGNYSEFIYIIYNSLKSWELSTHAFQHVFTQWIQSTYIVSGTPAATRKIRCPESSSGCMFPAGMALTGIYSSSLGYHQLRKLIEWFPEEVPVQLICPVAGGQNIHAVAPAKCSALKGINNLSLRDFQVQSHLASYPCHLGHYLSSSVPDTPYTF